MNAEGRHLQQALSLNEVRARIDGRLPVSEDELRTLFAGSAAERKAALHSQFLSKQYESLAVLRELLAAEDYQNQQTVTWLRQAAELADHPRACVEALRDMGMRAIAVGHVQEGFDMLQSVAHQAWFHAQRTGAYCSGLIDFIHDPITDQALASVAERLPPPILQPQARVKKRIVLLTSCLVAENSPSMVTAAIALGLQALGNEVIVVSTEFASSVGSATYNELLAGGIRFDRAEGSTILEKVAWFRSYFERQQADCIAYFVTPMDYVAKVVSELRGATLQCFFNMAYEHFCGSFDVVFQTTSPEQERVTAWPGKSKYVGSFAALEPYIKQATGLQRKQLQLRNDHVVLITHGRISKCTDLYLQTARTILERHEQAVLILNGPCSDTDLARVRAVFGESSVADRIIMLGPNLALVPELLRMCDVYLDPFPWTGGQSTLEAMWSGLPIVTYVAAEEFGDDTDRRGPIGAATDGLLPQGYERAHTPEAYVRIASSFIEDRLARENAGLVLRDHAETTAGMKGFMKRLHGAMHEALTAKELSQDVLAPAAMHGGVST